MQLDVSEMSEASDPTRGVAVQLPINLFGAFKSYRFRKFEPPYLGKELARLADARVYYRENEKDDVSGRSEDQREPPIGTDTEHDLESVLPVAYTVSLQPSPDPQHLSQDRYIVESWDMPDGTWTFAGVFDGHAGEKVSEYVHATLPSSVRKALEKLLTTTPQPDPSAISTLLSSCIQGLDDDIIRSLRTLFAPADSASVLRDMTSAELLDLSSPGAYTSDLERIAELSVEQIKDLINDEDRGGVSSKIIEKCKQGSTVLATLVDPKKERVWVAGLGDCVAVLGTVDGTVLAKEENQSGETPDAPTTAHVLSKEHNARVREEAVKVHAEHPNETTCLFRNRVLGAIAVTRALGDMLFKLPAQYTKKVFMNSTNGFRTSTPVSDIVQRVISPPYLNATAEVMFADLRDSTARPSKRDGVTLSSAVVDKDTEMSEGYERLDISTDSDVGIMVVSADAEGPMDSDSELDADGLPNDKTEQVDALDEPPRSGSSVSSPSLPESNDNNQRRQLRRFLILCSDGLVDMEQREAQWVRVVGESVLRGTPPTFCANSPLNITSYGLRAQAYTPTSPEDMLAHPALHLLKSVLGGEDDLKVSALLSLELMGRWMDDTTIVVLPL